MTRMSLKGSKKLREFVGSLDTEKHHCVAKEGDFKPFEPLDVSSCDEEYLKTHWEDVIPAPTMAEILWNLDTIVSKLKPNKLGQLNHISCEAMTRLYRNAMTEPEGMRDVEEYLLKQL